MHSRFKGSCLCGSVRFTVSGPLRPIIACHCSQCRKQTGNYVTATSADLGDFHLEPSETLVWFASSADAERGFCARCGSHLFWKQHGGTVMSIHAGAIDGPTGLAIEKHIFVADKPDWYEITDGKPQEQQWDG